MMNAYALTDQSWHRRGLPVFGNAWGISKEGYEKI